MKKIKHFGITSIIAALMISSGAAASEAATEGLTEAPEDFEAVLLEEQKEPFADQVETDSKSLRFAADWQEIYDALDSVEDRYYEVYYEETSDIAYAAAADSSAKSLSDTSSGTPDYSTTNLRDSAVDEADIVKTDGEYIYFITNEMKLIIVKADASDSIPVSVSQVGQSSYQTNWRDTADLTEEGGVLIDLVGYDSDITVTPKEMYIDGDNLILIRSRQEPVEVEDESGYSYTSYQNLTTVDTYDISDRSRPVLKGSMEQQGSYKQSRKNGDTVYLYTREWPDMGFGLNNSRLEVTVNGEVLEPDQFCIPELVTDREYLIISSVSLSAPSDVIDHKVYVSGGENCYVTADSLYVLTTYENYSGSGSKTEIAAFDTTDGMITGRAAAVLRGYVNDTWSIDEYDGYLRVLTTYTGPSTASLIEMLQNVTGLDEYFDWYDSQSWVRHNALYVLDENMERVGSLYDLAKNEEVRSARYFGEVVYFVTYERTDPVFCVDLSNPAEPAVLSELKVSGFSSYLHPYGDGRLLGIGYETDEDTGSTLGLKLSMFDTSTAGEVTEIARAVLPGITWCPALDDYRAIFVNADKNLIGLYYDERYMIYSFDEESGFNRELLYDYYTDDLGGTTDYSSVRGLYIGNELYLAGASSVIGFDMENEFQKELVLSGLG